MVSLQSFGHYVASILWSKAKCSIPPELIPVSVALSGSEYFYSPLNGMLVHRKVTSQQYFAGTHLYTWVEERTMRVKCFAREHNTMTSARARTLTVRSDVRRANQRSPRPIYTLMSRIERKYCLISTSCLTWLFDISILLHI